MASLGLTSDELKAVEQTRQRLFQLSNSIGSLKADVYNANPLPSLESLQASAEILQSNMRSLLDVVQNHHDLFTRLRIHPSTNFPGRTQENILLQLLRKKPEPDVAAAMDDGRQIYTEMQTTTTTTMAANTGGGGGGGSTGDVAGMLDAKWSDAREFIGARAAEFAEYEVNDDYTAEEREMGTENVRTGLRRKLDGGGDDDDDDDEEDSEEDEDAVMADRPPPVPAVPSLQSQASQSGQSFEHADGLLLDNILRVATRGELPNLGR